MHVVCLLMRVSFFYIDLLFTYMCMRIASSLAKVHFGSARGLGASRLPYYCTPLLCVPDVIGGLTVWRHDNKNKEILPAHTMPRELDGHPLTGCGSGFRLVPGYNTLSVRVWSNIKSVT